jgi:membrane-associated phospholipid phosphatase
MTTRSSGQIAIAALLFAAAPLQGQIASEPTPVRTARASSSEVAMRRVALAALVVASVTLDERLRSVAMANHSASLDRLTGGADILGTAGHIVPALASTYVFSRAVGRRSFADATLRVGLAYAAADALEALLKPTVGRVRPSVGREPLTFRPLTMRGDFHSFPSAHVVHISSIASATAAEANRPWVTLLGYAAVGYVGAQRVYRDQHWTSDVVASGMLGMAVGSTTISLLRSHLARNR